MIRSLRPKVRVHSWGGFGSQLNAIGLAFDLKMKFPKRDLEVVIRTGGIHNAAYELDFLQISEFQISMLEIKQNNISAIERIKDFKTFDAKAFFIRLLIKTGIYAQCNSRAQLDSLKPWITIVRGSYNFCPSDNFIEFLLKKIDVRQKDYDESLCCIHYRLGDLLKLESKGPIKANLLMEQIEKIDYLNNNAKYLIMSSDPKIAATRLKYNKFNFNSVFADPMQVLKQGINCRSFLGTNSKISLWVVFIRLYLGLKENFLPLEYYHFFDNIVDLKDKNKLQFY
jgi:hypothetical protein